MSKDLCTDKYGLLGQIQDDGSIEGGDTLNWQCHWIYLRGRDLPVRRFQLPQPIILYFEAGFGGYVRHFDPELTYHGFGAYYKNPWAGCISRDQLTGLLGMLIARRQVWAMIRVILHHACWLFLFSYNTRTNGTEKADWKWPDPTGPEIWAMEIRGLGKLGWILWPLLCVFDLQMLIQAAFYPKKAKADADPISFLMKFFTSREYLPTPTSWLTQKLLNMDVLLEECVIYWGGWRKQPGMIELYERKLRSIFEPSKGKALG